MNGTNTNTDTDRINNPEELDGAKCNLEQLNQIDNIPIEFCPEKYVKCQSKEIYSANDQKSKTIEEECKLKPEETTKKVDPGKISLNIRRNFPISSVKQNYPQEEEGIFDLLPLPFLQSLQSCEIQKNSMKNEVNQKRWKDFVQRLPESQYEIVPKPIDKYWRWKNYKKYIPEERTYFRKTMAPGPQLDQLGRPPIPDEELNKFRICRAKKPTPDRVKTFLKKGDGHRKIMKTNKI